MDLFCSKNASIVDLFTSAPFLKESIRILETKQNWEEREGEGEGEGEREKCACMCVNRELFSLKGSKFPSNEPAHPAEASKVGLPCPQTYAHIPPLKQLAGNAGTHSLPWAFLCSSIKRRHRIRHNLRFFQT